MRLPARPTFGLSPLLIVMLWLFCSPAQALQIEPALLKKVISEVVRRVPLKDVTTLAISSTRRAVSVGPFLGVGVGTATPSGVDLPLSGGLSLVLFNNPMLSLDTVKIVATELLEERLQPLVKEKIKKRLANKAGKALLLGVKKGVSKDVRHLIQLTKADYVAIAEEVWGTLFVALREQIANDTTRLPSPLLSFGLEVTKLPRSDAWRVRLLGGYGISKITVGPTLALHLGNKNSVAIGAEIALNIHEGPGPKPWHLQTFARYERYLLSSSHFGHQGAIGVRCIFDLL